MRTEEENKNSHYSPGPVADHEVLARLIYVPQHVTEEGRLKPEAIPRADLERRGFSVYRRDVACASVRQLARINQVVDAYIGRAAGRRLAGVAEMICDQIRQIRDLNGNQAFVVLDDAKTPEDCAHAAILFADRYQPSEQKQLRLLLLEKLHTLRHERDVSSPCERKFGWS